MSTLLDLFGFVSVLLHGLDLTAQTLLVGSVSYVIFVAASPRADRRPEFLAAYAAGSRWIRRAAVATVATAGASTALNASVLAASLDAPWSEVAGAGFVVAGTLKALAAAATGLAAARSGPRPAASVLVALGAGAAVVVGAAVATSHAIARLDGFVLPAFATGAHMLGAALWLGGLPSLRLALVRGSPHGAAEIGKRYSRLAACGVALIAGGACVFAADYLGSLPAVYGTAYGAMVVTKSALFAMLLALGFANFRAVRSLGADPGARERLRHFVEVEMGVGFAVLMAAASLTSLPPGVDLVEDRVTLGDIASRLAPAWPRLASPAHQELALPALQAELDAEARAAEPVSRPQAFVPGSGKAPPRNANDIAWSEYNHHWAGLLVAAMGLATLARRSGRAPWARHWPLLFLLLAAFLVLRADAEVWPLGRLGFIESLKDPEVAQHRLFEALIVAFALFEWRVSTGRIAAQAPRRAFPLLMALGGTLLLTHSHALGNAREELLIELTHLPIAVLGVAAGWARWLEVEAPLGAGRWAGWVWPGCFVLIGSLLLLYREA